MNLVYAFRKLVFVQVMLGIIAFSFAEGNIGVMVVAGAMAALAWYVVEGPLGRPLPAWAINLGALLAVVYLGLDLKWQDGKVLLAMGHFTMFLQVLELYGRKTNRDYGLILVLSLLQMVGASVLPTGQTLPFAMLLGAYCVLALFTVLVFEIKSTRDRIARGNRAAAMAARRVCDGPGAALPQPIVPPSAPRATLATPAPTGPPLLLGATESPAMAFAPHPVAGRNHRNQFRLMALAIAMLCFVVAVGSFLLMPRTSRFDQGRRQLFAEKQIGFTDMIQLGESPSGANNETIVLNMTVERDGKNIGSDRMNWLLRGASLDEYDTLSHMWRRGPVARSLDVDLGVNQDRVRLSDHPAGTAMLRAKISMRPLGMKTLFHLHPASEVRSVGFQGLQSVVYNPVDGALSVPRPPRGPLEYEVLTPASAAPDDSASSGLPEGVRRFLRVQAGQVSDVVRETLQRWGYSLDPALPARGVGYARGYARGWTAEGSGEIRELAEQLIDKAGLTRDPAAIDSPADHAIARVLTAYLAESKLFRYSLEAALPDPDQEPVNAFLFKIKEGHCEVYASALAALSRSVGLRTRVVTGYRVHEFNHMGGYYVVRQSDAHAWTEVYCAGRGWVSFDPTPPGDLAQLQMSRGRRWYTGARELYDLIEYHWLNAVLGYDKESRSKLFGSVEDSLNAKAEDDGSWLGSMLFAMGYGERRDGAEEGLGRYAGWLYVGLWVGLIGLFIALGRLAWRRWRMSRSGWMPAVPKALRRALRTHIRFYQQALRMVEHEGLKRHPWQTPRQFAHALVAADPQRYQAFADLTERYYLIRYGWTQTEPPSASQGQELLNQLQSALAKPPAQSDAGLARA